MFTSCHCEHGEVDGLLSSLQVGNVVCSDGNILSMDKFKQSDKEAVGIVFHVNRSAETDNLGYAVYIHCKKRSRLLQQKRRCCYSSDVAKLMFSS